MFLRLSAGKGENFKQYASIKAVGTARDPDKIDTILVSKKLFRAPFDVRARGAHGGSMISTWLKAYL